MILTMSSYPYQYVENYSTVSPTTPQVMSPWQAIDQSPIEMFLQEPEPALTTNPPEAVYEPHPIIQLEEVSAPVVVQHQHPQDEHSPPVYGGEGMSGPETKPAVHRDVPSRHSTSPVILTGSTGPIRHTPARLHSQYASHPYKRPQSAAPMVTGGLANGNSVRVSREHQQVRFAEQDVIPPPVRGAGASITASYRCDSRGATSPAATYYQNSATSSTSRTSGCEDPSSSHPRRFIVRADVYFDVGSKVLSALLELPGVKKTDVSVKLSTCVYNRVKQVTVCGRSRPGFSLDDHAAFSPFSVRERKYGEFSRTFAVPPDTKVNDVHAEMEDGILLLRVACHKVAEAEEPQEILVR